MKKLINALRSNFIFIIELIFIVLLLITNLYMGLGIYESIVEERVAPADEVEEDIISAPSLNTDEVSKFKEDQEGRKEFEEGVREEYTNRWDGLSKAMDPFLR